jgi:hypothetical protein
LLTGEFAAELSQLDFEFPVIDVRGHLDALIGQTIFEPSGTRAGTRRRRAQNANKVAWTGVALVSLGTDSLGKLLFLSRINTVRLVQKIKRTDVAQGPA